MNPRPRTGPARPGHKTGQAGSAVVEFALVAPIALMVTLALVQLTLYLYQRNAIITAVAEGARVAAASGRGPADGRQAACTLVRQTTGDPCQRITVRAVQQGDAIVLTARGTLPRGVPGLPAPTLDLTARMSDEDALVQADPTAPGCTANPCSEPTGEAD